MVKSVLAVNHQGLRDWLIQRVSALILALSMVGLACYFLTHPDFSFIEWRMLFAPTSMKIITLLVIIAFAFHAWIGIWTVVTDYIKWAFLRLIIHTLVLFTLVACFLWSLLIVWGF